MARQTTVNGWSSVDHPEGVLDGVGSFGTNLTNLALLQARLAAIDLREGTTRAGLSFAGLGLALVLVPGGILIALAGIALWIAEATSLTSGQALVLVAVVSLLIGALLGYLSLRKVQASYTTFRRSREELERNVAWIRTVVSHSGRS